MAELFQFVPEGLFRPLAAPGYQIYGKILLALLDETQRHQESLSRELALRVTTEHLTTTEALALTEDAVDEAVSAEVDELQARAGAVLRYLTRCGWLRNETQSDFTQTYILPDYAFRLLHVLSEIASNEPPPLRGLICAIHDMLQAASTGDDVEVRLAEAHRQTRYLLNGLKELQHNIGVHIEQVLRQLQARDILDQVFVRYQNEIVDRAYHQLRTTDHVSRYRPNVLETTAQLARGELLETAARRRYARNEAPSIEVALGDLRAEASEIREQFEALDALLEAIDVRHSQFVDAAVRTVELQLSASSTTSGQLHSILTFLLKSRTAHDIEHFTTLANPLVALFELALLDSGSLAPPGRAPTPFVPEAEPRPVPSEDEIRDKQAETVRQLKRVVSRDHVRRYAHDLLRERDEWRGSEIPLAGPDDLALLIYLRAYGDGSLNYQVEEQPDAPWVERDNIGFRDFVVKRPAREDKSRPDREEFR